MKRTQQSSSNSTLEGYIQSCSDIKRGRNSSTAYFDGFLQTSQDDSLRFVSFSPEKLSNYQTAHTMKSPVKISNLRLTPAKGKTEITIQKHSSLEILPKKLSFELKTSTDNAAPMTKIQELKTPSVMCSVRVKMCGFFDDERTINTRYGERKLRTAILADDTAVIKMPLWETNITKMVKGECYLIENLLTSHFQSKIQLEITNSTVFKTTEALVEVKDDYEQLETVHIFSGSVLCCNMNKSLKCISCHKQVSASDSILIKCPSCQFKQKVSNLLVSKNFQVHILNEQKETKKFIVFSETLNSYMQKNDLQNKTEDELENYFLLKEKLTIHHNEDSDVAILLE